MRNSTIREARHWASSFLKENHREQPVADLMLCHLLGTNFSGLLMDAEEKVDPETQQTFEAWISEHAETGKPLEHFTKVAHFYGRDFYVDEHVLIPRPETEELIQHLLGQLTGNETVADVGTGSGIIAITLKKEMPALTVLASDLSKDALQVAEKNAETLGAEITFLEGSFLEPVIENGDTVDVIISNPPYISETERADLSDTVIFDPKMALFAANDGLFAYQQIIDQAKTHAPKHLAFEIGYQQGNAVCQLIQQAFPDADVSIIQDINQKDRIVHAIL